MGYYESKVNETRLQVTQEKDEKRHTTVIVFHDECVKLETTLE